MSTLIERIRRRFRDARRDYYTYSPTQGWRHHAAGRLTPKPGAPPDAPLPPTHPDREAQVQEWVEHHEIIEGEPPEPVEVVELPPDKE